ncbi:N-acetylmuramoyl-L-alanine amidase [Alloalcanivorax sp. C16-1]|uniref:N-acetylmuramoyl-L-alanine amidase n=1 Tax=Alloalcanivorax sp. C16-1 TaxID=3390051 RepID=UPI003970912D
MANTERGDIKRNHGPRRVLTLTLLALGLLVSGLVQAVTVDSVRLHRAPDHTRIVFDLPKPVELSLDKLANPDRIVVDLPDTELNFDMGTLDISDSPITGIRVGQHPGMTRVVFDLSEAVRPRTNLLKPVAPHDWRLVVDLFDSTPEPVKTVDKPEVDSGAPRDMIVAVDPGHGGEDPGASGPGGLREKDVVLQIAKKVKARIDAQPGMKAVLVRDGDYYVPLAERRRIARRDNHADVFISIHADAFTDPRAHGASVFALSNRGATSARARYLAEMANESDKVAGVYEEEKDDSNLLSVLADMRMSGSMAHSLYLGRQILGEMGQITRLHGGRDTVEQAAFVVLKEPEMVSVLVETGFISNKEEASKLRSSAHQDKLARSIVAGVEHYFRTHPAPGSWFAAQRSHNSDQYRIQPGDTLSGIARRHQVTEQALRSANNIQDDRIIVGQTLVIPQS